MVDVEEDDRDRLSLAGRRSEGPGQDAVELAPVDHPGERIAAGLLLHLPPQPLDGGHLVAQRGHGLGEGLLLAHLVGDVPDDQEQTRAAAAAERDRPHVDVDRQAVAVMCAHPADAGRAVSPREPGPQQLRRPRPEITHGGAQHRAAPPGARPLDQRQRAVVEVDDPSLPVEDEHRVGQVVHQGGARHRHQVKHPVAAQGDDDAGSRPRREDGGQVDAACAHGEPDRVGRPADGGRGERPEQLLAVGARRTPVPPQLDDDTGAQQGVAVDQMGAVQRTPTPRHHAAVDPVRVEDELTVQRVAGHHSQQQHRLDEEQRSPPATRRRPGTAELQREQQEGRRDQDDTQVEQTQEEQRHSVVNRQHAEGVAPRPDHQAQLQHHQGQRARCSPAAPRHDGAERRDEHPGQQQRCERVPRER